MKRPSILRAMAEPVRASGEYATSLGLFPFHRLLPDGDGQPVLVLPGLGASDRSTRTIRRLLDSLGYLSHPWGLGRNVGPTQRVMNELPLLLDQIANDSGRTVSLIGWSLGGVYARQLVARDPVQVRSLITLGTPVRNEVHAASNAAALYNALQAFHVQRGSLLDDGEPLAVPVSAVHTRSDGIVPWQTCIVQEAPRTENLRVRGSHTGLGYNPAVAYIVADRLALPEGSWEPFRVPGQYRRVISVAAAS